MKGTHRIIRKKVVITSIMILIALTHFFTGSNYKGPYPEFVNGYLLDILVPFGFYFLLCLIKFSLLKSWIVRSILVFGVASFTEMAQFFGVPIFGRTFDPVDFVMFGIGVVLAAIFDIIVFPQIFDFWTPKAKDSILK
ncbi:hypothetical protein ES708_23459 [subsurface metagenome]